MRLTNTRTTHGPVIRRSKHSQIHGVSRYNIRRQHISWSARTYCGPSGIAWRNNVTEYWWEWNDLLSQLDVFGQVRRCNADKALYLFIAWQRQVPSSVINTLFRTADITARCAIECAARGRSRLGLKPCTHDWRISRIRQSVSTVIRTSKNKCHTVSTTRLSTFIPKDIVLGYYAAYSGNALPTFRDKLLVPCSRIKNLRSGSLRRVQWQFRDYLSAPPWPWRWDRVCAETSARNYHYTLRYSPEERSFHPLRGGSLI